MQNAIWGNGFASFWTERTRELTTVTQAHNGYLDMVLSVGFFGLLLQTIFLISCCWKAYKAMTRDFDWGEFWFCYMLTVVVHNIAESSISSFSSFLMAFLVFLFVCIPDYQKITGRGYKINKS